MFKLLFKYVIPLAIVVVGFILGYNYFFGSAEEKENSKAIISKISGLGQDVFNLLVSEKDKFDEGKYNDALEKIGSGISYLKTKATELADGGKQWLQKLDELEQEKQELRLF